MTDSIPIEIQEEIIKRLPVQSLLRFRTVSKQWKSLIDSSDFIALHYTFNETQPRLFLVSNTMTYSDHEHVSIVDDDSFPHHSYPTFVPATLNQLDQTLLLGSSNGLFCRYGCVLHKNHSMIVVWNPSIRKSIGLVVLDTLDLVGFGVCPKTFDVKIINVTDERDTHDIKADIFTLSTGAWRSMPMNQCLRRRLELGLDIDDLKQVVMNGVIHWTPCVRRILTFDLTSEEFGELDLPDSVSGYSKLFIYKPKESLALFNRSEEAMVFDVWVMIENGDLNFMFEKLFTFACDNSRSYWLQGCRMNGQLIMMKFRKYSDGKRDTLKVYDPSSKHMNDLEIDVDAAYYFDSLSTISYTKSLFMLNQPATIFQ